MRERENEAEGTQTLYAWGFADMLMVRALLRASGGCKRCSCWYAPRSIQLEEMMTREAMARQWLGIFYHGGIQRTLEMEFGVREKEKCKRPQTCLAHMAHTSHPRRYQG